MQQESVEKVVPAVLVDSAAKGALRLFHRSGIPRLIKFLQVEETEERAAPVVAAARAQAVRPAELAEQPEYPLPEQREESSIYLDYPRQPAPHPPRPIA
jgi:hypothetical protein